MARLNEAPMSSDSLETLRKKMLRQNRDLAKSNNVRALRIRELESECAMMLSENLELRGRILELETQVENNEARRIADHALAIKAKLEAQLSEWASLLSGLGLEPPMKRHSPRIRKNIKQRMSFCPDRPSPSQRRLRDIARDIEELGSISENRSFSSRQSLNPEQIRALRFKAADSAALESPPEQRTVEPQPIEVDSPPRPVLNKLEAPSSPRKPMEPPVLLSSPKAAKMTSMPVPSPEKKKTEPVGRHPKAIAQPSTPAPEYPPTKTGSKRKFAQDETEHLLLRPLADENAPPRIATDRMSIRDKAGGKSLKELAHLRNETRDKQAIARNGRKPLTAKSTNDDVSSVSSPKKPARPAVMDEVSAAKAVLTKSKPLKERMKSKSKTDMAPKVPAISVLEASPPTTAAISIEPAMSVSEPVLMSSNSPEPLSGGDEPRGDTPPPADISLDGETSRPSRRNRTTVSYAEPNLRVKMRRPTKELFDAVTGEGKYARRVSQCDQPSSEEPKIKRESGAVEDSLSRIPAVNHVERNAPEPDSMPASPTRVENPFQAVASAAAVTERPKRHSRPVDYTADMSTDADDDDSGDVDVYEFASSSPHIDKDEGAEKATSGRRSGAVTRRRSAAVDSDKGTTAKDRSASRRRSMMV
ncbi:hypothetical protein E4U41_001327 [Claviceps citrina]|nr:hypothetical protein E4U41_001327 [Claviceps citrina]